MSGKSIALANEFGNALVKHFGLPRTTTEVRIIARANNPVRIECDFLAEKAPLEEIVKLTKTYVLKNDGGEE